MQSRSRRLLVVVPWEITPISGVGRVVTDLLASLRAGAGWSAEYLINDWEAASLQHVAGDDPHYRRRIDEPPSGRGWTLPLLKYLLRLPGHLLALRREIGRIDPDVINVHYVTQAALTLGLLVRLRLVRARLVLSYHGSDAMLPVSGWLARLIRWLTPRLADRVVVVSHALAAAAPTRRAQVIHNGIGMEALLRQADAPPDLPEAARGQRLVVCVASFTPVKAHDVLLAAFAELAERDTDAHLLLVGADGSTRSSVEAAIAGRDLRSRVSILVDMPHARIAPLMRAAAVLVLASRSEGLPLTVLEAGALSRPVVATRVGGISEVVQHGRSGLLVPPDDASGLADAIAELLASPERAKQFGEELHCHVRQEFRLEMTCARYRVMLDQVVAAG